MRPTDVTHEPLTRERHAELVAELLRYYPRGFRVLFLPNDYIFADCDICLTLEGKWPHPGCGLTLAQRAQELRIAFMMVTEWDAALRMLRELVDLDESAYKMSIGIRMGGRDIMGEAV